MSDYEDTAGIRLVVHPGTRMPFPEDEGITAGPGVATLLGIKQVLNANIITDKNNKIIIKNFLTNRGMPWNVPKLSIYRNLYDESKYLFIEL